MKSKSRVKAKAKPIPYVPTSGLSDSGARTASVTGGLREPSDGVTRGRYDLIPPECLRRVYGLVGPLASTRDAAFADMSQWLAQDPTLGDGAARFARFMLNQAGSLSEGVRRLAVHYARGALKYADRNWEKGIETGRCVDSLYRHLGQWQAGGDQREDHLAAVVWNTFALMWLRRRITSGDLPMALDTYGLCK